MGLSELKEEGMMVNVRGVEERLAALVYLWRGALVKPLRRDVNGKQRSCHERPKALTPSQFKFPHAETLRNKPNLQSGRQEKENHANSKCSKVRIIPKPNPFFFLLQLMTLQHVFGLLDIPVPFQNSLIWRFPQSLQLRWWQCLRTGRSSRFSPRIWK